MDSKTLQFDFINGEFITTENITIAKKYFKDAKTTFKNSEDQKLTEDTILYEVSSCLTEERTGELNFGVTKIYPGNVNDEYFMTKGHYHQKMECTEFYWGIKGEGLLLLSNEAGEYEVIEMKKNTLCYIPRDTAHRLINTSNENFVVGACWSADAGHDYTKIEKKGFPVRVIKDNDSYKIIKNINI